MELSTYDKVIVAFSGGKDSTACFLHLLDQGVPKEKIELWHHLIDGEPGSEPFMDWPMTEEYCQKFAEAFDVPIYFSWRHGGFFRELMKKQSQTAPVSWENPDGTIGTAGGTRGKVGDRRRWPMPAAKLEIRWCSSVLKIDVMSLAINNQERFLNSKTLVITGERAGESLNRAKYLHFQPHRCIAPTKGKIVHHWRPILEWDEAQVWSIIEKYKVNAHPAYHLGWGRLSCITCIFGNDDQWASAKYLYPGAVERLAKLEEELDHTIDPNRKTIRQAIEGGNTFTAAEVLAEDHLTFPEDYSIFTEDWAVPDGAFKKTGGPI